jgi:predicted metalloprotease with PDZ domain
VVAARRRGQIIAARDPEHVGDGALSFLPIWSSAVRVRLLLLGLGVGLCLIALPPAARPQEKRVRQAKAGPIEIALDLTDVARKIYRTQLKIPASPGALTLYYPKWIPGEHSPSGPITEVAGLKITGGGKRIDWERDEEDPYAFHLTVPEGVESIEVNFQLLGGGSNFPVAGPSSPRIAIVNWHHVLLYPKGDKPLTDLQYRASLTLPEGWKFGTPLPIDGTKADVTVFKPVTLERLVDSPIICGKHFRSLKIGPDKGTHHSLEMACDSEAGLEIPAETKKACDRLIVEAEALFGVRHYGSYRFLLSLSEHIPALGIEHHECSDNRVPEQTLTDKSARLLFAGLLPHEYVHSWCGKHRRPAEMITTDLQKPQRTKLLWVYEGLTQYLMFVLTARCGLLTAEQTRDWLAVTAEGMRHQTGRSWRPLEDTTSASHLLYSARQGWSSFRRSVDFYDEGVLIWLEADTIIRQKTGNKKSLDDFCKRFFGGKGGAPSVKGFSFQDVVDNLNAVAEHSWKAHLLRRLRDVNDQAPLEGVHNSGWKLAYEDKPSEMHAAGEALSKQHDLRSSIGLLVKTDGTILDVVKDKAADKSGVAPGMKLLAVNGRRWTATLLNTAIGQTKKGGTVELLCENGDFFKTYKLDYADGAKFVRLVRGSSKDDLLADIIKAKVDETKKSDSK